jgi:hypothetical protein
MLSAKDLCSLLNLSCSWLSRATSVVVAARLNLFRDNVGTYYSFVL